eukprot:COSAG01_NODE_16414_length_1238_cov_1.381036_2_plen_165_part_00
MSINSTMLRRSWYHQMRSMPSALLGSGPSTSCTSKPLTALMHGTKTSTGLRPKRSVAWAGRQAHTTRSACAVQDIRRGSTDYSRLSLWLGSRCYPHTSRCTHHREQRRHDHPNSSRGEREQRAPARSGALRFAGLATCIPLAHRGGTMRGQEQRITAVLRCICG